MSATNQQVAEQVRRMVEGREHVDFADLFAPDGVMTFPFAPPTMTRELVGQDAIRANRRAAAVHRELIDVHEVGLVTHQSTDPEVIVIEITHHGWAKAPSEAYSFTALGVLRIREGKIVRYDDYMDPIALTRMLGRTPDLINALAAA
ncbi:nuclear transport factor 2 family protein [Allokutzneria sp. NRRL B-24872]|uniref:nuclear transport factor 2 family protein n=1 Tax=Allokutzneria sp. NRRL B-24872 TaxID=1137961 RepID=UPI000A36AAC1|nr:nuclear transport factor 2 family protein [Allokutzneria sp. NRRL B-24872]